MSSVQIALAAEVERLRAELAACREDAERYRWLRRTAHVDSMMRHVSYVRFIQLSMSPANMIGNDEKDIDTAVDAARKGEGEV